MANAENNDDRDGSLRMKRSADEAWCLDRELIQNMCLQDMQEENDRILAKKIAGHPTEGISNNVPDMMLLSNNSDHDDEKDDEALRTTESSVDETSYIRKKHVQRRCVICMEYTKKSAPRAPCDHIYCIKCLQDLFKRSIRDETLMPPRCCQKVIPVHLAQLTPSETEEFFDKQLEYSSSDRVYCSKSTCSAFIPPSRIDNGIGSCPKLDCNASTCASCKRASHGKLTCSEDQATSALLVMARDAGWARCYKCQGIIELTQGCYHMTCRCQAEFCYLCLKSWKTCSCPQWDERRLYETARDHVARAPDNNGGDIQREIERTMSRLRNNHDCSHRNRWEYISGGGDCERCADYLPMYLFQCSNCLMMVCRRCRHNRL